MEELTFCRYLGMWLRGTLNFDRCKKSVQAAEHMSALREWVRKRFAARPFEIIVWNSKWHRGSSPEIGREHVNVDINFVLKMVLKHPSDADSNCQPAWTRYTELQITYPSRTSLPEKWSLVQLHSPRHSAADDGNDDSASRANHRSHRPRWSRSYWRRFKLTRGVQSAKNTIYQAAPISRFETEHCKSEPAGPYAG
jgi:hypothetical protein